MEFSEKLQEFRKQKGLTQEELANELFVSRTAVSKWESGRGYPNIESLKMLARFFGVTVDELISADEVVIIAEEDNKKREMHSRDILFGLLDCSILIFLSMPLFRISTEGVVKAVYITEVAPLLRMFFCAFVSLSTIFGVVTLSMQGCDNNIWVRVKSKLSLLINTLGVFLFIISMQPYAATLLLVFLIIKSIVFLKNK